MADTTAPQTVQLVVQPVAAAATGAKPGYKTTEFWKSAVVTLFALLMASGVVPSAGPWGQIVGLVGAVLNSIGYASSRAAVKSADSAA